MPRRYLVCGQTPSQFERHAYCPPGIVFVSDRDPEHGHEAHPNDRMDPPPVLTYHILGQGMECEKQTVQDIEIDTHSMHRTCTHRTAEYGDRFTLRPGQAVSGQGWEALAPPAVAHK